jgi:hypothetical protein
MNGHDHESDGLDAALDRALLRSLPRPELPPEFRARLLAARERAPAPEIAATLHQLESRHQEQLAALRRDYIRMRRRTLATLIGIAFAAGGAIEAALPWMTAALGSHSALLVPGLGSLAGLAIALTAWQRRAEWDWPI